MKIEKIKLIETIVVIDEKRNDIARKVFIEVFFSGASDELMSKIIRYCGIGLFDIFDRKDRDSGSFLLTINKFIFGRRVVSYWSKSPVPYFMRDETIKRLSFELSSSNNCFRKDSFLKNIFFKKSLVRYEEDIITKEELYNLLIDIYWSLRDGQIYKYRNSNILGIFWMICDEMEA